MMHPTWSSVASLFARIHRQEFEDRELRSAMHLHRSAIRFCLALAFTAVPIAWNSPVLAADAVANSSKDNPHAEGEDWPVFLGLSGNGVSNEKGLAQKWPAKGPPVIWTKE